MRRARRFSLTSGRRAGILLLALALPGGLSSGCKRKPAAGDAPIVNAAWYQVPKESLARRRAGLSELTAAHDKLPIGTLLRVTRVDNGKTVTVRVTDRGIHDPEVQLDLCKEAAEELDMVSKGIARVRMEVVSEK